MMDAIVYFIACLVSFMMGVGIEDDLMHKEAIQHHVAHYDGATGNFVWNQ